MIFAADALAGRHVLVTGASSGLGRQAAVQLAGAGARLALVGRDEGRLTETLGALAGEGHSTHSVDMGDAEVAADAVQAIAKRHGTLDGVFHSAGTALILPARATKNRHLDHVFAASVRGAFGVARAAGKKGVVADGGSLVFMSSVAALRGRSGMTAYSAAKAAVGGLMRALASEMADRRIRVNSIISGAVETAMHQGLVGNAGDELVRNYEALHLLGFGRPEDVGYAALFLLSDASRWITGTELVVDGGYSAK